MSDEAAAFKFLLEHVAFQQASPSAIEFTMARDFDPRVTPQTYLRINWTTGDVAAADMEFDTSEGKQSFTFMRFFISTRTRIVRVGDAGIPPDSEDPIPSDVLMDASVEFMMEYMLIGCKADDLNEGAVTAFSSKQVPFNMWPYYRELVQSLAMRARIPVPTIPPFRLNKETTSAQK